MAETKINNGKYIFGDTTFKASNGDPDHLDQYFAVGHDGTDGLFEIGVGSDVNEHSIPISLADEEYFDLPADTCGYGFIMVGDGEEWVNFAWDYANDVQLLSNSTNVDDADTADTLSIFDNTTTVRIKNNLGSAKRILFEYAYTSEYRAWDFRAFNEPSGVDNLDPNLTINSTTETPVFRYKGGDAIYEQFSKWDYGSNIYLASSALLNQGSPGLGENDDSVIPNGNWAALSSLYADVTTEDLVFEFVLKWTTTNGAGLLGKMDRTYHASGGEGGGPYYTYNGYGILESSDTASCLVCAGGLWDDAVVSSAALTDGCWYHMLLFLDRSGSGQWYVNGVASGSAVDISSESGTLTNGEEIKVGTLSYLATAYYDSNLAYLAMWKRDAWLDTHLQATVAAERFAKFCGIYPQIASESYLPTTMERTYPAYIDKVEDGYRKLYYVGSEWLRMCYRQDSTGANVQGLLAEAAAENLFTYSEAFTNWSLVDAGDTVTDNADECPDGRSVAASIEGDSTDGQHGVYLSPTLTADTYAFSVFAQPGDKDWVHLVNTTVANCDCYFDVANGIAGTAGAGATGYIEGPFYGDFYRCCIVFTGTVAAHTLQILPAVSDTDDTFQGAGSPNLYMWQAQCELGDYMTSAIRTSGSASTRLFDDLEYDAGLNIGDEDAEEGTIMFDYLYSNYAMANPGYAFYITDGGSNDDSVRGIIHNTGEKPSLDITESANPPDTITGPAVETADGVVHEARFDWGATTTVYTDGVAGTPVGSITSPDDLDQMQIGSLGSSGSAFKGLIRDFRVRGPLSGPR